jgi:hypothetical protein
MTNPAIALYLAKEVGLLALVFIALLALLGMGR